MDYTIHRKAENGIFYNHYTYTTPRSDAISMHIHDDYEILYIVSGDLTHIVEDRKYKLKKDDLIIVRPYNYHYIQIDDSVNYERYNILFNPSQLAVNNINLLPENTNVLNCKHLPVIKELFRKTDYYSSNLSKQDFEKTLSIMLSELIYNLSFANASYKTYEISNPFIKKAIEQINNNLFTAKSIREIAEELSISESYLYRIFKEELYISPLRYINEKKLRFARQLLLSGEKPYNIYLECGFSDYTSFYRNYKKLFGHPPSSENNK